MAEGTTTFQYIIYFMTFILISVALINYMPTELYVSGYEGKDVILDDDFDIWNYIPREEAISGQITKGNKISFDIPNSTQRIELEWNTLFFNSIGVYHIKNDNQYNFWRGLMQPLVKENVLVDNWDSEQNGSLIRFKKTGASTDIEFIDANVTRNDISEAWNDGILNCTLYATEDLSNNNQYLGAREIVFAIITFRLPSIYSDINPLFGFLMSVFFLVPLGFITFAVILYIIHGVG